MDSWGGLPFNFMPAVTAASSLTAIGQRTHEQERGTARRRWFHKATSALVVLSVPQLHLCEVTS